MRKYFVTGLVILLPAAVTIAVVAFIVNFLTRPFMGIAQTIVGDLLQRDVYFFLSRNQVLLYGSQILILFLLLFVTLLLGALGRWFLVHSLLRLSDDIIHKIPFISTVYKMCQEVVRTILTSKKQAFKKVVLVPFPSQQTYCLGFVANEQSPLECNVAAGTGLVSVFVPTTPNPTSGYLAMVRIRDVHEVDMSVEQAIKMIISCGVINPEELGVIFKVPEEGEEEGQVCVEEKKEEEDGKGPIS